MLRSIAVGQFRQPHGALGKLAGLIMDRRPSNRERNAWTVGLLALEPHQRVLEIGCGPGVALKACAANLPRGQVVGIDHSSTMVAQARRKLAGEIATGRAVVRLGSLADTDTAAASYDRVFSLNVVQFFPDIDHAFAQVFACLNEQGRAVTTFQPRSAHPTSKQAFHMACRIEAAMQKTGFVQIRCHVLPMDPVPAVCVTGTRSHVHRGGKS